MKSMNFLEKLLDGVEVKWKPLGDVAEYSPTRVDAAELDATSFVGVDNLVADKGGRVDASYLPNTARLTAYESGDTLLGNIRPYLKKVWKATNSGGCSGDVLAVRILDKCKQFVSTDFLYYLLSSDKFFSYNMEHAKGAKMPRGNKEAILNYQIPIPCPDNPDRSLAIQAEIVRILDTFTALTAELTAELIDRKKQYEYYRDRLLTFEKGEVEWKTLGEVALDFGRGKSKHRPRNDPKLYGGNTPFIQTGDIRNASHIIETYSQTYSEIGLKQSKLWPKGTLGITIAANIAETSILGFDACFPDSIIGFVANPEKTTSGYVEYLLSSLKTKLEEMGQGSAQSNINLGTFENLRLPFPPLAEQVRIASLLDKFDTLTTSISEGLPREIALRQKQYEYYRDLLLSFPKTK